METITSYLMAHSVPNWVFGACFFFAVFFALSMLQMLVRHNKMRDHLRLRFAELLDEKAEKVLDELYLEISKLPEHFGMSGEVRDEFNRDLGVVQKTVSDLGIPDDPIVVARACYTAVNKYFSFLSSHNIKMTDELQRAINLYSSFIAEVWEEADWKCGDCFARVIRIMRNQDGRFNDLESNCFVNIKNLTQLVSYVDSDQEEE